jgi:hypothetical protein
MIILKFGVSTLLLGLAAHMGRHLYTPKLPGPQKALLVESIILEILLALYVIFG